MNLRREKLFANEKEWLLKTGNFYKRINLQRDSFHSQFHYQMNKNPVFQKNFARSSYLWNSHVPFDQTVNQFDRIQFGKFLNKKPNQKNILL